MLTPQEVRQLSQPSAARTILAVAIDWLLIALLFWVAARYRHFWVYIPCALLMARQQLALAILMHDAAHRRLFKSIVWNDVVGQLFCAAPLFFSMYSYKQSHLKHHTNPLAADDPDISLIGGYPISRASFRRKLTRDLFGVSYFKFIRYFIYMSRKRASSAKADAAAGAAAKARVDTDKFSRQQIIASIFGVNALLFLVLWKTGHPGLYLLWVLPTMTLLQLYLRIRGIAEHAGYTQNSNQMLNARTVRDSWQTFLVAPHRVNYHIEHHLYPSVPFFRLPELHKRLKDDLPASNVYSGYGTVLAELVK